MSFTFVAEPFHLRNLTAQMAADRLNELADAYCGVCTEEWLATATDDTINVQVNLANAHFLDTIGLAKNVLRQAKKQATEAEIAEWDRAYQRAIAAWLRAAARLLERADRNTSLAKGLKLNITSAQQQLQPVDYTQMVLAARIESASAASA